MEAGRVGEALCNELLTYIHIHIYIYICSKYESHIGLSRVIEGY